MPPGAVTAALVVAAASGARGQDLAGQAVGILRARCTECHDADGSSKLSLLSREEALRGGKRGPAIVPGNAQDSRLFQGVSRTGKPAMPPDDPLPAAEVEVLRRWLDAGAPWPEAPTGPGAPRWWAFRKPQRPAVPASSDRWVRSPVDAFVARTLREKGLAPSPDADRSTFVRRATFDLHGLAPTAEETRAFVDDRAPDAYERLIDRLLASPRYGER